MVGQGRQGQQLVRIQPEIQEKLDINFFIRHKRQALIEFDFHNISIISNI